MIDLYELVRLELATWTPDQKRLGKRFNVTGFTIEQLSAVGATAMRAGWEIYLHTTNKGQKLEFEVRYNAKANWRITA